ncbi:MAG: MBL fold metallo-hydrolase [Planctomycetota bacterium]|nr:MBL fold metallo-hydrolase [Planctomycetota bacterium]MEE2711453.1 MBL fold metallo-hydrolase [Planctomycetota bacterium]
MKAGPWQVRTFSTGRFRLDGGAMFGNVPRVLWERSYEPDRAHRIELELRVVLFEGNGRKVLVDTGTGNLWSDKEQGLYDVDAPGVPGVVGALKAAGIEAESITDVILTHLHFDHAGGVTRRAADGTPVPTFPSARHHLQRTNLDTAREPNERERKSYLRRHWEPLLDLDLVLHEGAAEVLPGLFVDPTAGHTEGLQVVRAGEGEETVVFPADVIPLASHVRIPWTMGYDLCPRTLMDEKRRLLRRAAEGGWAIVLEHDPHRSATRVVERGGRFEAGDDVVI